jgi:hypothetical protein
MRSNLPHRFDGLTVAEILQQKKASIRQAPLPARAPGWEQFSQMTWAQIEQGAKENQPGFKAVRKLLADRRFDR